MTAALATEDPAVAAAMGRCLAARSFRDRITRHHPRLCGWCDYPTDELQAGVEAFRTWAGFDDRASTSAHHAVRHFAHDLSREAQEALVVAAQAFPDEDPGMGVKSFDAERPVGPRGSRVAGETGSNVSASTSRTEPAAPVEAPAPAVEEEPSWMR